MNTYYVIIDATDTEKGGQVIFADYFKIKDHILMFYDNGNPEPKFLFHYWQMMFDKNRLPNSVPDHNE